jgi:hypothetical protein
VTGASTGEVRLGRTLSLGGPPPPELHTFIMRPATVALPLPITHPVQLYHQFIRSQRSS